MSLKAVTATKRASVLCLFDYLTTTGFGTVSENIVTQLRRHFGHRLHLDIVAINYFGDQQEIWQDKYTRVIRIPDGELQEDSFGRWGFLRLLNQGYYSGCFMIHDPGTIVGMMPNLQEVIQNYHRDGKKRFRSLAYFPIDSKPLNLFLESEKTAREMLSEKKFETAKEKADRLGLTLSPAIVKMSKQQAFNLANLDQLVTYTEYGKREILAKRPDLRGRVRVIGHGVNPHDFYAQSPEERQAFREQYFGVNAHKTIVTNINRNQYRKDIPSTIMGFKYYLDHFNADAFLYLHMNPIDALGWHLYQICDNLGLIEGEHYAFPPPDWQNAGAEISTLRSIYNASDIFLTTSSGEGWGLTVIEAMMCQCAVVAPMHTSLKEICGDGTRAWPLENLSPNYFASEDSVQRYQCDYVEIAEVLDMAVRQPQETEEKKLAAYEYARQMTWAQVCRDWIAIFEELYF